MNKYFLIAICIFFIWIMLNYIILVLKNKRTSVLFKRLESLLIKKYSVLNKFLSLQEFANDKDAEEVLKYLNELMNLPKGIKFLNRKLALDYIISKLLENIFSIKEAPSEYKIIKSELKNYGNLYNNMAMSLKHSVEIFPTSIIARFVNIKTVDFYRG